jgi:hypothetical protein
MTRFTSASFFSWAIKALIASRYTLSQSLQ